MPPLLRFARYRDIAADLARRLAEGRAADALAPWPEEVIVPSRGVADAKARYLVTFWAADREAALAQALAALRARFPQSEVHGG